MPTSTLTRRAACGVFVALTFAAAAISHGALARHRTSPAGIHVEVGPLRANAGDPTATWVAEYLPCQLAQALAQRGARANVSVRVDYLTLGSSTGGLGPAGSSYDNIQGVATINGGRGVGASDLVLLSLGDRLDDDRTIEPGTGGAADRGSGVLDRPGRAPLSASPIFR